MNVNGGDTLYIVLEGYAVATGIFSIYIEQQAADLVGDSKNNPLIISGIPYFDNNTSSRILAGVPSSIS